MLDNFLNKLTYYYETSTSNIFYHIRYSIIKGQMSYLLSKFDTSQPNLLYYDLNIKNFVNDTQQDSQQLLFIEQRSGAIITNYDDLIHGTC
jgi:hypothetical protein